MRGCVIDVGFLGSGLYFVVSFCLRWKLGFYERFYVLCVSFDISSSSGVDLNINIVSKFGGESWVVEVWKNVSRFL